MVEHNSKVLARSKTDRLIAGVCGGLAEYFSIDPLFVRAVFFVFAFFQGFGFVLYLVLWFVMPEAGGKSMYEETSAQFTGTQSGKISLDTTKGRKVFGTILIVFGAILLINNLLPHFSFAFLLPPLVILFGLAVLFADQRKGK